MIFLNVKTPYSLLYGASKTSELLDMAANMGHTALGCADNMNFYGIFDFHEKCHSAGIKPVTGVSVEHQNFTTLLFARNYKGFRNISMILSRMNLEHLDISSLLNMLTEHTVLVTDSPNLIRNTPEYVHKFFALHSPEINGLKTASQLSVPPVAVPEISWITQFDYRVHTVLKAIDKNTVFVNPPESPSPHRWPDRFSFSPEAMENTLKISDLCCDFRINHGTVFPSLPTNSIEELRKAAYLGAEQRYGELSESVIVRLDYELDIINRKGFADYFLIVQDIVSGSSRTCGRGSGAASIVSYVLGITNVDPLRYNLFFERFLNMERVDPPDIDVDFAWDERTEIIDRAMEKYGRNHTAMVCNHVHFKPKSAIREVARVWGVPEGEISRMQKYLSRYSQKSGRKPWSDKFYSISGADITPPWDEILSVSVRIMDFPRYISVHPGGIVITPEEISSYVPVEKSPGGVNIINWEKDWSEEAGLVKIDLLGNRSLGVIRDALANIKENGLSIPPGWNSPADDPLTRKLIAEGNTMGVFYVESPAMRQLQKKTGKGDFEHLVIHSSIIRPAANKYIREYVLRLKGKPYTHLHKSLENILSETYGIMCYQEDVSRTAMALAGFSEGKADALRKILSKKNRELKLREMFVDFKNGAEKKGVSNSIITEIWNMILSFDGYSFCKPHSASYAMVSFQSAWLKTHFPAEFIAGVLTNQGGFYSPAAYISEGKRMGLTVLPPDVNKSFMAYRGCGKFLRVGFMAISGLHKKTVDKIVSLRIANGDFTDFNDFVRRIKPDNSDLELLVNIGALDSISGSESGPSLLWRKALTMNPGDLFSGISTEEIEIPVTSTSTISSRRKNRQSNQFFLEKCGFLTDIHPLQLFDIPDFIKRQSIKAADMKKHTDEFISVVGWPVTRRMLTTIRGELMQFVSFEDETAIFETVLFPEVFGKYGDDTALPRPFLISGTVKSEFGEISLIVERVEKI
ncbi:MAG: DNA polymerase III subunit alpha [Deltaproteobacteria bacterium]|nr:DNA polymerase III subunit alpha [Deltaproteobacteria bacterium]